MLVKNAAEAGNGADSDGSVCRCVIKDDSITVLRTLGIGEFGVVQHAVWAKDTAHQVSLTASLCLCLCLTVSVFLSRFQITSFFITTAQLYGQYLSTMFQCGTVP